MDANFGATHSLSHLLTWKVPIEMRDLFGNVIEEPIKTFKQEYAEYIRSAKWKQRARAALVRAKNKCERCGLSKWSGRLEVHHRTYEHFKSEPPEDLEVVCKKCHDQADVERLNNRLLEISDKLYEARLDGWASKVWGEDWEDKIDYNRAADYFDNWLRHKDDWP